MTENNGSESNGNGAAVVKQELTEQVKKDIIRQVRKRHPKAPDWRLERIRAALITFLQLN